MVYMVLKKKNLKKAEKLMLALSPESTVKKIL